jgi:enolase-phosphatase E1
VTIRLADRGVRVVLLDIEGTTTPIAFVHEVLFPFARRHLRAWIEDHATSPAGRAIVEALRAEHADDEAGGRHPPAWRTGTGEALEVSIAGYAGWLMDQDRKSPPLKRLQGLIWEEGYKAGLLRGIVYADVPGAIARWRDAGIRVAIYSSGSELAQRRLFESTEAGDLTPQLCAFFDTAVGAKVERESYTKIARALGEVPRALLFVSDVTRELTAAASAGCQAVLSVRPGNPPQPDVARFDVVSSFDEIGLRGGDGI